MSLHGPTGKIAHQPKDLRLPGRSATSYMERKFPYVTCQVSPSLSPKTVSLHFAGDESYRGHLLKIQPPRSLPLEKLIQWV